MEVFGDYVVYVDESGDHSLDKVNSEFPVFVLAFCIFRIDDYVLRVVPELQKLKFDHFGHDMVVLHEREIRRRQGVFSILLNEEVRAGFLSRLNKIIACADFTVIATVIDKPAFVARRGTAENPYHVALEYGLERVFLQLQRRRQSGRATHVIFESRGATEDEQLRLEYERIMETTAMRGMAEMLRFRCAPKAVNSSGLQMADMVARPIGLRVMRPGQENRSWDVIEPKMPHSPSGSVTGWGLKVYPHSEFGRDSEKPPA